jgi:hypothetical protein
MKTSTQHLLPWIYEIVFLIAASGCAHYPINQPLKQGDPGGGIGRQPHGPEKDDQLLLMLSFTVGGTRVAAFSCRVLETFGKLGKPVLRSVSSRSLMNRHWQWALSVSTHIL